MSVAKHTPWVACTYGNDGLTGRDWFVHGKDNVVIARVFDSEHGRTPMSAEDHALLIAAAPETAADRDDLAKRLDFAATALGVVERRRDELRNERDALKAQSAALVEALKALLFADEDQIPPSGASIAAWAERLAAARANARALVNDGGQS